MRSVSRNAPPVEDGRVTANRLPVAANWPHRSRRRAFDPLKYAANATVTNALRLGDLVRQPCAKCGDADSEAHHEDYSKPLDVTWLCRPCHNRAHGRQGRRKADSRQKSLEAAKPYVIALTQTIRDEMDRQGVSQHELAKRLGMSQCNVSGWFTGGFKSFGTVALCAEALGLRFVTTFEKAAEQVA